MSFWDSSAILPLCVSEPASPQLRSLYRIHGPPVVWWATLVECHSAVARQTRSGGLSPEEQSQINQLLRGLAAAWHEMQPTLVLRERALRLLAVHNLPAADALQLAAALTWAGERPNGRTFMCLDARLREVALREGFTVTPRAAG